MTAAFIKLSLSVLLAFYTTTGISQTQLPKKPFSVFLKLNPLSLLDPNYPTIQPGVEARYKAISIGYKLGPAVNVGQGGKRGIAGEVLSYSGQKQKWDIRYWGKRYVMGIEIFKGDFTTEKQAGKFYDESIIYEYSYDYVNQKDHVWGIGFKSGVAQKLGKRFLLDFATTIGMRSHTHRNIAARIVSVRELDFGDKEWRSYYPGREGTRKTPHFSMELSIGYLLF